MNQPLQLNTYTGTLNPGHTADLTCNGPGSCPGYPKTDEQGRATCCFPLPQASDGITALSSVIYQNGAQNLNDFQVAVDGGQSFDASNDLGVFFGQVIAVTQCSVILPAGVTQSNTAQFRLTWTYHSNSADNNAPSSPTIITDGTLPVNVLRVTSNSAFVQQGAQYNEWFVCPPLQDGQISLLQSIAVLAGNNIDYLRCIYVNNQGVPLKDPTNGQILVFSSSKNATSDNPTITMLPAVHTDCVSIQFFPNSGTSVDLASLLLSITIAFQTAPTTDASSMVPQVSDLQGTSEVEIDITIDISLINDDSSDNAAQTIAQAPTVSLINTSSNGPSAPCIRYQFDVPILYDNSIDKYTGTFDVPSQYPQQAITHSVTVSGSPAVQNPITMLLVDSQGNILSPSYSLNSGSALRGEPTTSISKIILQATALQDAVIDSTLHTDIVVCPENTEPTDPPLSVPDPSMTGTLTATAATPDSCPKWNINSDSVFIVNPDNLQQLEGDLVLLKDDYGRSADLVSVNVVGENIAEVITYLIKDISTIIPDSYGIQDPSSSSNSIIHYFNKKILADIVHVQIRGGNSFKISQIYFVTCYDMAQVIPDLSPTQTDPSSQVNNRNNASVLKTKRSLFVNYFHDFYHYFRHPTKTSMEEQLLLCQIWHQSLKV
jgi:hypothetical protein